jgi:hypothetical protein
MSNEFANKATTTYESGKTDNYFNGAPRFRCNNVLKENGTSDANYTTISEAKDTYAKLYHIYNEKEKGASVDQQMFDSHDDHCSIGPNSLFRNCPYTATNLESTNVFAYTAEGNNLLVKDLKFYLDDCGARIRDYDKNNSSTASYKPVKEYAAQFRDGSYNTLVKTRSDLDNKMNEILGNNKNSILYEKQGELDATVYSTLLWTVMVTSLLYYVFTKI